MDDEHGLLALRGGSCTELGYSSRSYKIRNSDLWENVQTLVPASWLARAWCLLDSSGINGRPVDSPSELTRMSSGVFSFGSPASWSTTILCQGFHQIGLLRGTFCDWCPGAWAPWIRNRSPDAFERTRFSRFFKNSHDWRMDLRLAPKTFHLKSTSSPCLRTINQ